jgi:LacI family transcriptional regulator
MGLLVDHLTSLGHTEIAHVGGVGSAVARERADAFRLAMERHGLADQARVEPGDFTEQVGQTAGSMLLRGSQIPTAVTCATDVTAVGVLSAAREAGFEVPSQLAVAGFGNTSLAASGIARITSIDPNSDRARGPVPRGARLGTRGRCPGHRGRARARGAHLLIGRSEARDTPPQAHLRRLIRPHLG